MMRLPLVGPVSARRVVAILAMMVCIGIIAYMIVGHPGVQPPGGPTVPK
jgi:hypothetical protein